MNAVETVTTRARAAAVVARGVVGEGTFEDPENARIIYLAVGGLVLLAIGMAVGTWWWWHSTKVEHPALGPLEMMGTRSWRKGDFNTRVKRLEAARPANAIHEAEPVNDPEELDLDALGRLDPVHFDDFSDLLPADAPVVAAAAEVAVEPVIAAEPVDAVAEVAAAVEPVVEAPAEPVVEPPVEPVVEVAAEPEPVPARRGVIVIDTAPAEPVPLQLSFDADTDADSDDGDHFDPLLRSNTAE